MPPHVSSQDATARQLAQPTFLLTVADISSTLPRHTTQRRWYTKITKDFILFPSILWYSANNAIEGCGSVWQWESAVTAYDARAHKLAVSSIRVAVHSKWEKTARQFCDAATDDK